MAFKMKNKQISLITQFIKNADAILITAGAGMGVDSGLPDFRGNQGFWKEYPAIQHLGLNFEDIANPKWFSKNPPLAWAFYGHRLNLYRDTTPHNGFKLLLDLIKEKNNNYFVVTSNVDGQFQKAGFDEDKIYEVHGSIHHFQCSNKNCKDEIWDADKESIEIDIDKFEAQTIPLCKNCDDIARPNILMFGDWDWNSKRSDEQEARFHKWFNQIKIDDKKLAIIEIGAGTAIPTIRNYSEIFAKKSKKFKLIRINPRDFYVNPHIGFSVICGGLDGLKQIFNNLNY